MTKKIFFALATFIFLPRVFATIATEPEPVFQCGQDFQRELSLTSNKDYILSEGFSRGGKDIVSSHAYFFVRDMNFRLQKSRCTIEIRAQNISNPTDRVRGKRAFYKFKFQFTKSDPTNLVFFEDGKGPTTCTVNSKFVNRLKNCNMAPEIPEALVCQSQVVQGTQIKTVFRVDPKRGISERQVYKLTLADAMPSSSTTSTIASAEALTSAATPTTVAAPKILKEEDLGVRSIKMKWAVVDKACQLKITEADENPDQLMDFVMKVEEKPSTTSPAYFNKMRITLDKDHVADLMDDKKNVQCTLSNEMLHQANRCSATTTKTESPQKKEKKPRKRSSKKS